MIYCITRLHDFQLRRRALRDLREGLLLAHLKHPLMNQKQTDREPPLEEPVLFLTLTNQMSPEESSQPLQQMARRVAPTVVMEVTPHARVVRAQTMTEGCT